MKQIRKITNSKMLSIKTKQLKNLKLMKKKNRKNRISVRNKMKNRVK